MDKQVPIVVFESTMVRFERTVKRLFICLIVAVVVILLSNLAWLYMWNQYDYVTDTEKTSYEQDGSGANVIGNGNEVKNGAETDD